MTTLIVTLVLGVGAVIYLIRIGKQLENLEAIKQRWVSTVKSIERVKRFANSAKLITSAWMMTLALFLTLTTSCQSLPGGSLNIAYPERPENPSLSFEDTGGIVLTILK